MKKNILFLLLAAVLVSCSGDKGIRIQVSNNSAYDRAYEVVEIKLADLNSETPLTEETLIVVDANGKQVPRQFIYNGGANAETLLFPVTLKANESAAFFVKAGTPESFPVKTFGRLVPERKDDFAWENDRVVYRVYGPPLAREGSSNGVDLWLKKTDRMIIDQFYNDDLNNKKSYHVDHGDGLDCYKVGYTLGAGMIAPFADGNIVVQGPYSSAKVIDTGVLRTVFEATIDSVKVGDNVFHQRMIVSLDAGSQFNKATVYYTGDFETMNLAAGIFLHDVPGNITNSVEDGYINYAENVKSDAGVEAGRSYISLYTPAGMQQIFQDKLHIAAIVDYKNAAPYTYYFGSGWSQWGFESDEAWNSYVKDFIQRTKYPVVAEVVKE